MKPDNSEYFFTTAPTVKGSGALNGNTFTQDGDVYKTTLAADISEDVVRSDVIVSLVRLENVKLDETTKTTYLRFEQANGNVYTTGSSSDKADIAVKAMQNLGYTAFTDGTDVTVKVSDTRTYTVDASDIKDRAIRFTVDDTITYGAATVTIGNIVGSDATIGVSVTHADGTVDCYAADCSSETDTVQDGDVIVKVTAAALTAGNPSAPTLGTPVDGKLDVSLTGNSFKNLPDVSKIMGCYTVGGSRHPFPTDVVNYTKLRSHKLAVLDIDDIPLTDTKWTKIEVVNNAQVIYDQDPSITGNVKVAMNQAASRNTISLSTLVWDDEQPIVVKVYTSTDTTAANLPATPTFTITIDTSGVSFK